MNSYGERLAHGTDQGKWLIQEVDMQKPKKKKHTSEGPLQTRIIHI